MLKVLISYKLYIIEENVAIITQKPKEVYGNTMDMNLF